MTQAHQVPAAIDPITLAVVRGALETAQREMTLTLEKTGRSSVFNLAHDYSNALFDHLPEMILQGQDIPIHLGSLIPAMKAVADFFGDDIHEGDVIYHNDPVYQGSHILDCCMYKPVFYQGELVFWAVCKGHLTDIGGPVPAGYNPDAKEIYAEGLRIPPVKLWDKGRRRDDVVNLLLCNMRARRDQEGDLNAQFGACRVGEHSPVVWNLLNRSPSLASRSIVGIWIGPPKALGAPKPMSSIRTIATLGAPAGGRTGCRGGKCASLANIVAVPWLG